jgi:hypothetical protein
MDSATTKQVMEHGWDVTSLTVYGILVMFMALALFFLWKENKGNRQKLMELLASNIQAITTFTNKFDGDGQVLRDKKIESMVREVVKQEVATIKESINTLSQ